MTKDEALRLALEAFGEIAWSNETQWQSDRAKVAITAIEAALEAKDEPAAWIDERAIAWLAEHPHGNITTKLELQKSFERPMPLYTTTPQRKPLTDEEIQDALEAEFLGCDTKRNWQDDLRVARAIEAAHGIKGEA